jgi:outer membrane immunogenic protein
MRSFLAAAVLCVASIAPASAQDSRPALWQGFYLGAQVGRAVGESTMRYPNGRAIAPAVSGSAGGLHLGYNIRRGDWVFGPELTATSSAISGTSGCANPRYSCKIQTNAMAHLNARIGHAFGNALLYGTGGISSAHMHFTSDYVGPNAAFSYRQYANGQSHGGWNVGVGIEYAMTASWSAGLEYRHVELSNVTHPSTNNFDGAVTDRHIEGSAELVSARLNYNFGAAR